MMDVSSMSNKNRQYKNRKKKRKERYYFFLNPYIDCAFTRCPKCETKTKVRKYCLLIHIDPHQLLSLNKTTKYCPYCDLIILKKEELEQLLCAICEERIPEIIGNDYLVLGTMDRKDWKKGVEGTMIPNEAIEYLYPFKDVWSFKVQPRGWYYDPSKK